MIVPIPFTLDLLTASWDELNQARANALNNRAYLLNNFNNESDVKHIDEFIDKIDAVIERRRDHGD